MLLPHTLTSESGIVENRAKIQGYGEVLEPSMVISWMAMFEMERQATNLAANGPSDAEFLRGLKRDSSRGARNRAEREAQIYMSQKRTTAALTQLIELMADRLGRAIIKAWQVVFRAHENLDAFNEHVQEIQRQAQNQVELQKKRPGSPAKALMNLSPS